MAGTPAVHPDFRDLLQSFVSHDVRFLVVGAFALAALGRPRATNDLDVWIDATPENAERVIRALRQFGAPLGNLSAADLARPGIFFVIGVKPVRIDVLTEVPALQFPAAWENRIQTKFGDIPVGSLGPHDFVANKRAAGRAQDLADAEAVERLLARGLIPERLAD